MSIAYKSLVLLYAIVILVCSLAPHPVSGNELVGIAPFTNQRDNPANDWLGYYIQARLQSFLAEGCEDCRFHSLSTIHLWQHQVHKGVPITVQNTVLITGSFQFVLDQGILDISLKRFTPRNDQKEFAISFARDELEIKLDKLFLSVAKWIQPGFRHKNRFSFPRHTELTIQKMLIFRKSLYEPTSIPDLNSIRELNRQVKKQRYDLFVADIAEGMIFAANQLLLAEKKTLLIEVERMLRSAAMNYVNNARIHALLSETFFLLGKQGSWVSKSAEQARDLDENNSLALLMLILSDSGEKKKTRDMVHKLNDINPWIWPDKKETSDLPQFQKGLFRSELESLQEYLQ